MSGKVIGHTGKYTHVYVYCYMCKRRWLFHQKYLIQLKYAFYWFDVTAAEAPKAADERWINRSPSLVSSRSHVQNIYEI